MMVVRALVVVSWSVGAGLGVIGPTVSAQERTQAPLSQTTPGTAQRRPIPRPPWMKPDTAEIAARRTARTHVTIPSATEGIELTATQTAQMAAARERYRPRMRALMERLQSAQRSKTAFGTPASTAELQDSVRVIFAAQREAVLAVLTPAQRSRYTDNQARIAHARAAAARPMLPSSRPELP